MAGTPESLCNTSVEDARASLHHINDWYFVRKAYEYERAHQNRVTMKKMLEGKMVRLWRERNKNQGGGQS